MLTLTSVRKRFPGHLALDAFNLRVAAGEAVILLGPSGCGKSTVLRTINGLVIPDSGRVEFLDQTVSSANIEKLRLQMGYVIQDGGLFPHLSARDNVALMGQHLRWSRARIAQRIADLADTVHLPTRLLDRLPGSLSGGERQRVALMRSLLLDPALLLLDEPLGALDPMIRYELQSELKALFERLRKTVVLVTHDLNEAAWFADRIVLMRDGKIEQEGTVADLIKAPASPFVSLFIQAQRERAVGLS